MGPMMLTDAGRGCNPPERLTGTEAVLGKGGDATGMDQFFE